MVKQLHTNESLSIDIDLCQLHYQNLLKIYQKNFIVLNAKMNLRKNQR